MLLLLLFLSFLTLTQQQNCQLPQVFKNRISHDLEPFQNGITTSMLEKAKKLQDACVFTIKNGTLLKNQGCILQSCYDCQQGHIDLPDLQFAVSWLDEPRILKHPCNKTQVHWTDDCYCDKGYVKPSHGFFESPQNWHPSSQLLPLFGSTAIKECFRDILIPSNFHYSEDKIVAPRIPWSNKEFKVFWRGGPTGGGNSDLQPFRKYHRHKLIERCWNITDCDANFSHRPGGKYAQQFFGTPTSTNMRRQAAYKILIDIDGYTYSSRFTVLLKLGAAVMKIAVFDDIGFIATKPWEHYIPVDISLKDLEEKIQWAKENDEQVQKIAIRGKQLADSLFTSANYYCYLNTLLREYHKLLVKGGAIPKS